MARIFERSGDMRMLWLDYQQTRPGWQWPGYALLVLSIGILTLLIVDYAHVSEMVQQSEHRIHRLERQLALSKVSAATDTATAPGNELAQRLSLYSGERWDALFADLEDAADETVTLISITPGKELITLEGEAKTLAYATAYAARLKDAIVLRQAELSEFATAKGHPRKPIRFTLTAQWPRSAP